MSDPLRVGRSGPRERRVLAVSDASGDSARCVVEAAAVRLPGDRLRVEQVGGVRTAEAAADVVRRARDLGAIVVGMLRSPALREAVARAAEEHGVVAIDLLGPLVRALQVEGPLEAPGPAREGTEEEGRRAVAMQFAVRHDDGQRAAGLETADLVLVGPSRTSKTPLSLYLSYHGWRVANVPLLLHVPPPPQLFAVARERVVGLTATSADLLARRRARSRRLGVELGEYTDMQAIRRELALLVDLCRLHDWRVVSVSGNTIEETAATILDLVGESSPVHP